MKVPLVPLRGLKIAWRPRLLLALCAAAPLAGCDLELDATRPIPAPLERRIAQAKAELAQDPADLDKRTELGMLFIEAERYFAAAETLKQSLDAGADDAKVHAGLAEAYLELGYFKTCADHLRTCFSKNKDEPGCLYIFGALMEGIDDREAQEEAQRSYRRLLQVAPDFRKAKLAKSSLDQVEARLANMGPPSQPAAADSGGAAAAPTGADPHAGVDGAPKADPHAGIAGAPSATNGSPPPPDTPGHEAPVDPASGKEVGGLNPFGEAIMTAVDAVRKNDAPAAEAAFRKALEIRPDDPAALAGLAEAEFAQGRKDAAVATIEKAYAKDPKDPQVRWAFGRIMIDVRKRMPDALEAWRALVKDEPEYAERLGVPTRLKALEKFDEAE